MSFSSLILQVSPEEDINYLPKVKKSGCVSVEMCSYMSYVKSSNQTSEKSIDLQGQNISA